MLYKLLHRLITLHPGDTDVIVHKATEAFRIVGVICAPVTLSLAYRPSITWTLLVNGSPISGLSNISEASNAEKIDCEIQVGSTVILRVSHNQPSVFVEARLETEAISRTATSNSGKKNRLSYTDGLPEALRLGIETLENLGAFTEARKVSAETFRKKHKHQFYPSNVFKLSRYPKWKEFLEQRIKSKRGFWWLS